MHGKSSSIHSTQFKNHYTYLFSTVLFKKAVGFDFIFRNKPSVYNVNINKNARLRRTEIETGADTD